MRRRNGQRYENLLLSRAWKMQKGRRIAVACRRLTHADMAGCGIGTFISFGIIARL